MAENETVLTSFTGPGGMHVEAGGAGPMVVFVHGGGMGGPMSWREQVPLAARWRVVFPFRPGYGPSPLAGHEDFEVDAGLIAELLGDSAHLVGHSYGGVVALLAAARRPGAVRSLTVVEPGCTSVARGVPIVDDFRAAIDRLSRSALVNDPSAFIRAALGLIDPSWDLPPDPLPPPLVAFGAHMATRVRWPDEAVIPVEDLAAARWPKLVVTGDRTPVFAAISDALAGQIGAERVTIPDQGHSPQDAGPAFNDLLEETLRRGEGG